MSSSSGEEVEVEVENHVEGAGHGKGFNWHGEDIRNLARQIVSKISPDESIAPFDSIDINWTDIGEALGLEGELCRRKWSALCNSVRTYRTLPEIAVDILSQNSVSNPI
ncbi:uncharacterized protein LOC132734215 [Ruditapes philippinarum]|uniref:uncharacterized protein LOC132734215 n=1 Tax=Ruditapes philippinarum TaxID=129788 RepID=UPI00295BBBD1|nr:uncharacterized protein LOC132734215 [Ruditapes philippinarum]